MTHNLNASSRIMWEAANALGITTTEFGDQETILMEYKNTRWYTRGSRTSLQSSVGRTIADLKPLTKKILTHFSLPTANSMTVNNQEELVDTKALHFPVVMKPIDGGHGKDVFVGIQDSQSLLKVYQDTFHNRKVLIEEMLQGTEYRIMCVNFTFVAAAIRKPAHVIGDDEHTIEELVAEKNKHPWRGAGHTNNLSLIIFDHIVDAYLAEQGLQRTSVPTVNQVVNLRRTANLSTGGEAWDVSDTVCPENKLLFEKISRACDLNVCGIDVICHSLSEPITDQTAAGVIEVNASPGLRMHHYPIQGEPKDVATIILQDILRSKDLV